MAVIDNHDNDGGHDRHVGKWERAKAKLARALERIENAPAPSGQFAKNLALALAAITFAASIVIGFPAFKKGFQDARAVDLPPVAATERLGATQRPVDIFIPAFLGAIAKELGSDVYHYVVKPLALTFAPGSIDVDHMVLDTPAQEHGGVYTGSIIENYNVLDEDIVALRNRLLLHRGLAMVGLAPSNGFSGNFRFVDPRKDACGCAYRVDSLTVNPDETFHGEMTAEKSSTYAGSIEGRFVGRTMDMTARFLYPGETAADARVPVTRLAIAGPRSEPLADRLRAAITASSLVTASQP